MIYAIEYEHLKDDLITDRKSDWAFNQVKNSANKHSLELSDEDFMILHTLQKSNEDTSWLIHKMSAYNLTLTEALIKFIFISQ